MALLEVKNLGISFGGLRAVDEFNISIEKGELYGLIGPNGDETSVNSGRKCLHPGTKDAINEVSEKRFMIYIQ